MVCLNIHQETQRSAYHQRQTKVHWLHPKCIHPPIKAMIQYKHKQTNRLQWNTYQIFYCSGLYVYFFDLFQCKHTGVYIMYIKKLHVCKYTSFKSKHTYNSYWVACLWVPMKKSKGKVQLQRHCHAPVLVALVHLLAVRTTNDQLISPIEETILTYTKTSSKSTYQYISFVSSIKPVISFACSSG